MFLLSFEFLLVKGFNFWHSLERCPVDQKWNYTLQLFVHKSIKIIDLQNNYWIISVFSFRNCPPRKWLKQCSGRWQKWGYLVSSISMCYSLTRWQHWLVTRCELCNYIPYTKSMIRTSSSLVPYSEILRNRRNPLWYCAPIRGSVTKVYHVKRQGDCNHLFTIKFAIERNQFYSRMFKI